jgi:hypothetical protein
MSSRKLLSRGEDLGCQDWGRGTPSEDQKQKEEKKQSRPTRPGTLHRASANGFHFGRREFWQFGCFHKMGFSVSER